MVIFINNRRLSKSVLGNFAMERWELGIGGFDHILCFAQQRHSSTGKRESGGVELSPLFRVKKT